MSINAINSVSLYEYYYQINKDKEDKKKSPLADEMERYGLKATDNEALNVALLKRAKEIQKSDDDNSQEIPYSQRPWADLMYQLNIPFNTNPKDDIEDIKEELAQLTKGVADEELEKEVSDLESYIENLYLNFQNNYSNNLNSSVALGAQLNNLAVLGQVNLL